MNITLENTLWLAGGIAIGLLIGYALGRRNTKAMRAMLLAAGTAAAATPLFSRKHGTQGPIPATTGD